ncbi:MAG: transketolase [Candidatus Fermentibacteraceae bacterium]
MEDPGSLRELAVRVRLDVLEMIRAAGSGHPGGSLSLVELLVHLYFRRMSVRPEEPRWEGRDRLILSKGHACPALYSVLARRGYFDPEVLLSLRKLDSPLQGHPDMRKLPGLDASTGSLGQGLSTACGMARGLRLSGTDAHVYCVLGDGELQEGSVWEAAMSGRTAALGGLTAIVDRNGVQLDGRVDELKPLEPLRDKWEAFGWTVLDCDGHDFGSIHKAFEQRGSVSGPAVILARTTKGKGVSFMEDTCLWHGGCPDEEEYARAVSEIRGEEVAHG